MSQRSRAHPWWGEHRFDREVAEESLQQWEDHFVRVEERAIPGGAAEMERRQLVLIFSGVPLPYTNALPAGERPDPRDRYRVDYTKTTRSSK